jgi:hypothetical protein
MVTHDPRAAGVARRRLLLDKGELHEPELTAQVAGRTA